MKKEELFEELEEVDAGSVKQAQECRKRKRSVWLAGGIIVLCAALLVGAWFAVPALRNGGTSPSHGPYAAGIKRVMAEVPQPIAPGMSAQEYLYSDDHRTWLNSVYNRTQASEQLQAGMNGYYAALMGQLLPAEDENTICSPLNTYIAFAVLAEVTDGNTRQQILDMLGVADIDTLRTNIDTLWNSNCVDTPSLKSLLANSLWLRDDMAYNDETLRRLAETYYASTFSGTPGSAEMDEALRRWTDDNTGGLLKEYTKDMKLDEDTVLDIVSTLYYKATWQDDFEPSANTRETFHGTRGDTTVDMMHQTDSMSTYRADRFTAVSRGLVDSGAMYFLLPNEGVDVNTLATDPDVMKLLHYDEADENWSHGSVNLSLPKFKVSAKSDLSGVMRALGVTDAFDYHVSDFSPLTADRNDLFVSKAEHAATLEVDEDGVLGAAYTEIAVKSLGAPPQEFIEFTLDRPFLFLVTGRDGSVLFSGIVRNL